MTTDRGPAADPQRADAGGDEIPELERLADEFAEGPPRPAPTATAAEESAEAPALEVEVTPSAADGEDPDEQAPTSEYGAVDDAEGQETNLYNPSVATMLARLTQPEVAAVENPHLVAIRRVSTHIEQQIEALKEHTDPEAVGYRTALDNARETCVEASELIDTLPADDEGLAQQREDLVTVFVILRRTVKERSELLEARKRQEQRREAERRRARQEAQQQPEAPAEAAPRATGRSGRRWLLPLVVLLLAGARIWIYVDDSSADAVEHDTDTPSMISTINRSAAATERELARGIPAVLEVHVMQSEGELHAFAIPVDPDGDPTTLIYKWLRNGQIVQLGRSSVLPADKVEPGAAYQVEVQVSDGKHEGQAVTTLPLVAGGGASARRGARP